MSFPHDCIIYIFCHRINQLTGRVMEFANYSKALWVIRTGILAYKYYLLKILNFHNHELSMSGKITSPIWFYNFCVQLLYTNYFLLILISNVCHLDGKVYTYHPNILCWFWSSVTHFNVFMLELKYLWEPLPFQLQHRTDKIIFLNWLPSSQSL